MLVSLHAGDAQRLCALSSPMDLRKRRSLARGGYSARAVLEHQGFPFPLANHKPHSLSVSLHAIDATTQGHGFELISTPFARAGSRLAAPARDGIVHESSDSDSSGHKDSSAQGSEAAQRKPLRHLLLLGLALLFGALLGAVSTTTTPSPIVAPPHSRLRFVESKTTEEQPARPTARRPSTRRLRFTKI